MFLGCFVEGETVALTGGVLAHRHLLVLWQVTLAAISAAFLSDISIFLLGRRYRNHPRIRALMQRKSFARAFAALDKGPAHFASVFRFIPGLRIAGPLALAQSRIATLRFAIHAGISAVIWGVVFTTLGHAVGQVLAVLFGEFQKVEHLLIVPAILIAVLASAAVLRRIRRIRRMRWRRKSLRDADGSQ